MAKIVLQTFIDSATKTLSDYHEVLEDAGVNKKFYPTDANKEQSIRMILKKDCLRGTSLSLQQAATVSNASWLAAIDAFYADGANYHGTLVASASTRNNVDPQSIDVATTDTASSFAGTTAGKNCACAWVAGVRVAIVVTATQKATIVCSSTFDAGIVLRACARTCTVRFVTSSQAAPRSHAFWDSDAQLPAWTALNDFGRLYGTSAKRAACDSTDEVLKSAGKCCESLSGEEPNEETTRLLKHTISALL
jgi:hypothetical protein